MKDILPKILLFLNIVFITLTLYFSSWVFYYQYEPEYYENYYYHSQWNIPNSVRGIGDGDLYKFVGYQLANGENPFNINYEVPPLVKLLYGITEKYTGNPYIVSILFYFLSIYVLYKFSEIIFNKNKTLTLSCILLFVTSPFIATQLKETMLDLPLTFFFLSHLYFFYKYYKTRNIKNILFSGIFLGFATGTKIGVYTPILGLLSFLILLFTKENKRKILTLFTYTSSVFIGYILSYVSYFLKHPNPIPWVRLHQKTISFYLGTQNSHYIDKLNQLKGIFLNQYQGFWLNASRTTLGDWSPLIPIGTVLILVAIYFSLKNKNKSLLYMALFSITILFINSIIPFYPRYLMPLIPVFCIFIVYFFQKKYSFLIFVIALLNIPFFFKSLAINKNTGTLETTIFFFEYQKLYTTLPGTTTKSKNRNT
ncbi:MAG: glycosyltransferase family 39 protein [Candidatus Shapirobacteria bacterium]